MPQTDPAHFLVARKLTDTELAQAIRLDLESELDAMNLYQSHIAATDNEVAKKVLAHIRDEEREHAALFWALLKQLDPQVAVEDAEAVVKLRLIAEGRDEAAIRAVLEAADGEKDGEKNGEKHGEKNGEKNGETRPDAGAAAPANVFTVGSLRPSRL